MKYSFSVFVLDSDNKQLLANSQPVSLTKQNYNLLLFLVQNSGELMSKEKLIETVWRGRVVENNSINRSVSKLRNVLNTIKKDEYFESVYGQGVKFLPIVRESTNKNSTSKFIKIAVLLSTLVLVFLYLGYFKQVETTNENTTPLLVVLPNDFQRQRSKDSQNWLNASSDMFMDQLLTYANTAVLKDYNNKPESLSQQEYLKKQWEINPSLQTISSQTTYKDNIYTIELTLNNRQQTPITEFFRDANLSQAFKQSSLWLHQRFKSSEDGFDIQSLIPTDSHLTELYLRGLVSHANGEYEKAINFFELCLLNDPMFHMARLELARAKYRAGKQDESLILLDTLSLVDAFPVLEIEMGALKANILEKQGKHEQARDLSLALIEKFSNTHAINLEYVRNNLSRSYATLTEYDLAIKQLEIIEADMAASKVNDMLANVLQNKGRLLLKLGRIEEAKNNASRAMALYHDSDDFQGKAGMHHLLGTIATQQADYQQATDHFNQTLAIAKSANYQLGVGVVLKELTYLAMVQGQLKKARKLNQETEQIAIEVDYKGLLLASEELSAQIAITQRQWDKAAIYLNEHLQLSLELKNKTAEILNKQHALEFLLAQNKTAGLLTLVNELQQHINQTGENRLQPLLDKQLARYYFLIGKAEQALTLLESAKTLAIQNEDGEIIIKINNLLAQHHLNTNQAQKALSILNQSYDYKPVAYPYLLLKAQAQAQLNNFEQATMLAKRCKQAATELWTLNDEKFLAELNQAE